METEAELKAFIEARMLELLKQPFTRYLSQQETADRMLDLIAPHVEPTIEKFVAAGLLRRAEPEELAENRFFMFTALDNMGLTTEERLYLCGDATYDDGWRDMWQGMDRQGWRKG